MEVLHVTRVTAASSGTYTSTVVNRAARPSAYTGAPNNGMCDTGGVPRGHRRYPRRYRQYLCDVNIIIIFVDPIPIDHGQVGSSLARKWHLLQHEHFPPYIALPAPQTN